MRRAAAALVTVLLGLTLIVNGALAATSRAVLTVEGMT